MSKYTPGPLKVIHGERTQVLRGDGLPIATVHSSAFDAQLFASAPELLEACKLAEKYFREMIVGPEMHYPEVSMLRTAIAKAEGK